MIDAAATISNVVIVKIATPAPAMTVLAPVPSTTVAAAVAMAKFVIPSPSPALASLATAFPSPPQAPTAAATSISLPTCTTAAVTMTMMFLTTVTVRMLLPIIPALTAAETPALAARTMMAYTLIPHTPPAATAPPLCTKRIISAAHCLNCAQIVWFASVLCCSSFSQFLQDIAVLSSNAASFILFFLG